MPEEVIAEARLLKLNVVLDDIFTTWKLDAVKLSEQHYLEVTPVKSTILGSKIVRPVGPRFYQTVVDVKIEK